MARGINTARRTGTTVPRIQGILYEPGQTFKAFAVVVLNANGNVQECASPAPTSITGVSLQGAGTGPGFDVSDASKTAVYTGRFAGVSVAMADRDQEFSIRGVNGGTDPQVPVQADIGHQFGIKKVVDDWVLDYTETVNVSVYVTDIDTDKNFYYVKFLDGVMTNP